MDSWIWVLIGVAVVVVLALVVMVRGDATATSPHLQERFGPEYERTVDGTGCRREAERDLRDREAEHDRLDLQPFSPRHGERYMHDWESLQPKFVDRPQVAVTEADALVTDVMRERGYPVDDWEHKQRARVGGPSRRGRSTTGPRTRSRSAASPRGRAPRTSGWRWCRTGRCSRSSSWTATTRAAPTGGRDTLAPTEPTRARGRTRGGAGYGFAHARPGDQRRHRGRRHGRAAARGRRRDRRRPRSPTVGDGRPSRRAR